MHIDIITCLPRLIESPFNDSILKRAQAKGLVEVNIIDLREYATDKHKSVDDYAYGGGAGMVMMIEPIDRCLQELKAKRQYDDIIYMSPEPEEKSGVPLWALQGCGRAGARASDYA
jgi:tRNA (guanine37-N1)-methyltransferase